MNEKLLESSSDPIEVDPAETEQAGASASEPECGQPDACDAATPEEELPVETPAQTPVEHDPAFEADTNADRPDSEKLEQLREELKKLQQEIQTARESLLRQQADLEEFHSLWPDVSLASLPDPVLADVRRGVPLAAAYALMERRQMQTQQVAKVANEINGLRSSGAANGDSTGYLSINEVRAMSPEQVRKHYQQILQSMPKWH